MTDLARFDLHVHSKCSPDSRLSLEVIISRLSYAGLKGFALTDHNTVAGHAELAQMQSKHPEYLFLPGIEISTVEGHLLSYGIRETPPLHAPLVETIEWVTTHGGEAVLSHPFRPTHGVGRKLAETAPVVALETRNSHNSEIANLRAEEVAARRHLGATGGSDTHTTYDVGRAYTGFDPSVATVDDLLEHLRRGRTTGEGKSLTFTGRVRSTLRSGTLLARRGFRRI
jgi:predicted metal-dependent phosphoesterase TrpH